MRDPARLTIVPWLVFPGCRVAQRAKTGTPLEAWTRRSQSVSLRLGLPEQDIPHIHVKRCR